MEENKKELTPDPEEMEVKTMLLKVAEIAQRKKIPLLCLTKLDTLDMDMTIGIGNPISIIELIEQSIKKDPVAKKMYISAVAICMLDENNKSVPDADLNLAKHVQKNDPAGN
ncbi:hypothetical protein [Dysgonomonas termitidis]|uniref:SF4 helicase domain-containing protein n=1 Tax=Dysgonomonas termitidis TaxID=1516126 RepID=A0ABV9KV62_9BACT